MNPSVSEIPRPAPRVAKELLKSNGFLLARMGIGFKTVSYTHLTLPTILRV